MKDRAWDMGGKTVTKMEVLAMKQRGAVAAVIRRQSGIWDMLSLRYLFSSLVERSRGSGFMSLGFRAEVWAGNINLGVVSSKIIFKAMKLDELTRG